MGRGTLLVLLAAMSCRSDPADTGTPAEEIPVDYDAIVSDSLDLDRDYQPCVGSLAQEGTSFFGMGEDSVGGSAGFIASLDETVVGAAFYHNEGRFLTCDPAVCDWMEGVEVSYDPDNDVITFNTEWLGQLAASGQPVPPGLLLHRYAQRQFGEDPEGLDARADDVDLSYTQDTDLVNSIIAYGNFPAAVQVAYGGLHMMVASDIGTEIAAMETLIAGEYVQGDDVQALCDELVGRYVLDVEAWAEERSYDLPASLQAFGITQEGAAYALQDPLCPAYAVAQLDARTRIEAFATEYGCTPPEAESLDSAAPLDTGDSGN